MNVVRSIWTRRYCYNRFKFPVLLLLTVEFFFVVFWCCRYSTQFNVQKGFLVKDGKQYLVFWIDDERQQSIKTLPSLKEAISFAKTDLGLRIATDTLDHFPVESIWMKHNIEGYSVYWRPINTGFLNRLTFTSLDEAENFKDWFRRGAYSPSPIGHSLALIPIKKN